jgi:hypothetical protein
MPARRQEDDHAYSDTDQEKPHLRLFALTLRVRIVRAVAATHRVPLLRATAVRARWKRLHRLDSQLVAAFVQR